MLIVMRPGATESDVARVIDQIQGVGLTAHVSIGKFRTIIGAVGDERERLAQLALEAMSGVEKTIAVMSPYKFVAREFKPAGSIVEVGEAQVGRSTLTVIAGPASIESQKQAVATAKAVKEAGASILKWDAFEIDLLEECKRETQLPVIAEIHDAREIERVSEVADALQIGARNMQNFLLLREVGLQRKPVLLKRGFSNTVEELLMSAEYIAKGGNDSIVLCERGIRTFETSTPSTLDLTSVPSIHRLSHLPVVVDPCHAAGRSSLVFPLALAAVGAGADGLLLDVHPNPQEAHHHGEQALDFDQLRDLMKRVMLVRDAVESGGS